MAVVITREHDTYPLLDSSALNRMNQMLSFETTVTSYASIGQLRKRVSMHVRNLRKIRLQRQNNGGVL